MRGRVLSLEVRNKTVALLLLVAAACAPQTWTGPPQPLDRIVAQSEMTFGNYSSVRVLSDGRVLITDDQAQQLWMLDKNLRNARLIGDSTAATNRLYAIPGSYIRPYLGDSTMLVKSGLGDAVILDGQGRAIRNVSFRVGPTPGKGPWTGDMIGAPFTKRGELMVLSPRPMNRRQRDAATAETIYVVRTSFDNPGKRDTVGQLTRQLFKRDTTLPAGSSQMSWIRTGDGAGMLQDGTIGIVRTKGYRVEWIDRKGKTWTTPIPHEWTVLTPADKQQVMDSLRVSARTLFVHLEGRSSSPNVVIQNPPRSDSSIVVTKIEDIADTVPPIGSFNQVYADADGHLWVEKVNVGTNPYRTLRGDFFDVIDRRGRLVRRVVLPFASQVKAFRPGRVYYTVFGEGGSRLFVARTK